MVAEANPKYPNPTIVEVLCEIHFERSLGPEAFDISKPLQLYSAVSDGFPELVTAPDRVLEVISGSSGQNSFRETVNQRLQFFAHDRQSLIQLGEEGQVLAYNVLKPYPGWETLLDTFEQHWDPICAVIKPNAVKRVGLRYINHVDFIGNDEKLSSWLKPNKFLADALIASSEPFEYRASLRLEEHRDIVINVNSGRGDTGFVFDIDVVWHKHIGIALNEIKEVLTILHNDEWEVFSSSITEKYNSLLQKKN